MVGGHLPGKSTWPPPTPPGPTGRVFLASTPATSTWATSRAGSRSATESLHGIRGQRHPPLTRCAGPITLNRRWLQRMGGAMRFARFVLGGAIAASGVLFGPLPAFADGPPSPPVQPGCTFNGSTGQSTCVTTQTGTPTSYTLPPFTNPLPAGVTITQLCDSIEGTALSYNLLGLSEGGTISYEAATATTTTTVHQGVSPDGHQVSQSTIITAVLIGPVTYTGTVTCTSFHI